jgi:hypothetical protein
VDGTEMHQSIRIEMHQLIRIEMHQSIRIEMHQLIRWLTSGDVAAAQKMRPVFYGCGQVRRSDKTVMFAV